MRIGCLGDIGFEVSSRRIKTISGLKVSGGNANYSLHARVGQKELPELTGYAVNKCEFDMVLSAYLGADPFREYQRICKARDSGTVMPLTIGRQFYGNFVIQGCQMTANAYDRRRGVSSATVRVTLIEYPEE